MDEWMDAYRIVFPPAHPHRSAASSLARRGRLLHPTTLSLTISTPIHPIPTKKQDCCYNTVTHLPPIPHPQSTTQQLTPSYRPISFTAPTPPQSNPTNTGLLQHGRVAAPRAHPAARAHPLAAGRGGGPGQLGHAAAQGVSGRGRKVVISGCKGVRIHILYI